MWVAIGAVRDAYIAIGVSCIVTVLVVFIIWYLRFVVLKQGLVEIETIAGMFPNAFESITHAELPAFFIATAAQVLGVSASAVSDMYLNDAQRREAIALFAYKKDSVTDKFLSDYASKFCRHGYVGEELLTRKKVPQ
ncbi:hypothetical protein AAVH_07810 [Aphelenchoides avenae]|nr:hypothetical protein AAVH_07810 [Aphelenchus avenae]